MYDGFRFEVGIRLCCDLDVVIGEDFGDGGNVVGEVVFGLFRDVFIVLGDEDIFG